MAYTFAILLIILGALAIPSLLVAKKPELKPMLDKLTPFQGYLGILGALWGLWGVIQFILNLSGWMHAGVLHWITYLATVATLTGLGILLGVGTAKTFIKDPTAQKKMDETVTKLQPYQGKLGIAGIVIGLWSLISMFL